MFYSNSLYGGLQVKGTALMVSQKLLVSDDDPGFESTLFSLIFDLNLFSCLAEEK